MSEQEDWQAALADVQATVREQQDVPLTPIYYVITERVQAPLEMQMQGVARILGTVECQLGQIQTVYDRLIVPLMHDTQTYHAVYGQIYLREPANPFQRRAQQPQWQQASRTLDEQARDDFVRVLLRRAAEVCDSYLYALDRHAIQADSASSDRELARQVFKDIMSVLGMEPIG